MGGYWEDDNSEVDLWSQRKKKKDCQSSYFSKIHIKWMVRMLNIIVIIIFIIHTEVTWSSPGWQLQRESTCWLLSALCPGSFWLFKPKGLLVQMAVLHHERVPILVFIPYHVPVQSCVVLHMFMIIVLTFLFANFIISVHRSPVYCFELVFQINLQKWQDSEFHKRVVYYKLFL